MRLLEALHLAHTVVVRVRAIVSNRGWSTRNCTTRSCRQASQGNACFGVDVDRGSFCCFGGLGRLLFLSHTGSVPKEVD